MELQNYIFENTDYLQDLKDRGFIIKNFNKYNLKLIKYPYGKEININTHERYLKGCIIDSNTNKLVFIPPVKANELTDTNIDITDYDVQELYDRTMSF